MSDIDEFTGGDFTDVEFTGVEYDACERTSEKAVCVVIQGRCPLVEGRQ